MAITGNEATFYSSQSQVCMCFGQLGVTCDNLIIASGKFLGEGNTLRKLSKARFIFHVVGMPLLAIPITNVALHHHIFHPSTAASIRTLLVLYATFELFRWLGYDTKNLRLVDLRGFKHHKPPYLAGTMAYSSGRVVEMVLPAMLLIFYEFFVGWQIYNSSPALTAGPMLSASALLTFFACSVKGRPDIQLLGENLHCALLCAVLALLEG